MPLPHGCFGIQSVVVKKGPEAYKTVTLRTFGNPSTGEISRRELRCQAWNAKLDGSGFDFEEKAGNWFCERDEIDGVLAFLSGQLDAPGTYRRVSADGALVSVIRQVEAGEASAEQIQNLAQALADSPSTAEALAHHSASQVLIDGIQAVRHREVIASLKAVVDDPSTRETALQKVIESGWWIFGGRYIGKADRRTVTALNQLDVPLIRADGVLQVVELKTANIPDLAVKHRNHYIVGPLVNEAVGQVANYLRDLDEQRHIILESFGIECRRARATVVIGHPKYVSNVADDEITKAIRTYNSHLARIEVMTYDELIRGAEAAVGATDSGPQS